MMQIDRIMQRYIFKDQKDDKEIFRTTPEDLTHTRATVVVLDNDILNPTHVRVVITRKTMSSNKQENNINGTKKKQTLM